MTTKRPTPPGFPVSTTSMLIAAVRRQLKQIIGDMLEPTGLTPHQFWALLLLRELGPQALTELAAAMWMDHPTMSRTVHALQNMGYVTIRPNPLQGRRVIIQITPQRKAEVDRLAQQAETFRQSLEAGVLPEEKAAFRSMMLKLLHNLETLREAQPSTRSRRRPEL